MNFRLRPGPGDEKRVKKEMNKIGKRAIPILVLLTMVFSLFSVLPASAAISITSLSDTSSYKGDTIIVKGSGVTAGATVGVYWDNVLKETFSDGTGKMNSTTAKSNGSYEVWFDVPEAVAGTHYVWVRDLFTGDTYGGAYATNSAFDVESYIKLSPSSGLPDDKITIKGYGFGDEVEISSVTFGVLTLDTSPVTPETNELGSWTATFRVPNLSYLDYPVEATDADINSDSATFTIGAAVSFDVSEGPVGTVVEVSGRGFTDGVDIVTGKVTLDDGGTPINCKVIDDDTVDDGKFKVDIVIPQVSDTDEYTITVDDGTETGSADFEVTGLAEIDLDPQYGVQGSRININGYNFTAVSGEDVKLELWDQALTGKISDIKTFETTSAGEFSGTFTVPARASGRYAIVADQPTFNIDASKTFRIGMIIVILSPSSGPSGTLVTLTGTGFTENESWNSTFGDLDLIEGDVDVNGNIEATGGGVPTFFVPTLDPGTYTVTVLDIDAEIEVEVEFEVTAKTMIETDPMVAPNGYNVTIKGKFFSAEEGTTLEFVLWNETDDWDMTVEYGGTAVETDEDGNFTGYWEVLSSDDLSIGTYLINCTDENDLFAQYEFQLVPKTVQITPRKATFRIGETVHFNIESSFSQDDSYIEVMDPAGDLYWRTDAFADALWLKVGTIERVPYYSQTAGGNPMLLLDDAPLGTWSWTWYDSDDEELDSGTFTVEAAPEEVIGQRITDLEQSLTDVKDDIAGVKDDIAGVKSDLQDVADAAEAARQASQNAQDAITSIGETANSAKDSADAAKEAAEEAGRVASGLTTLVYGAIGASLVAALAAIVSLMQISRRIAG